MFFLLGFLFFVFFILPILLTMAWRAFIFLGVFLGVAYVYTYSPEFIQQHFAGTLIVLSIPILYFYILHKYGGQKKGASNK